MCEIAQSVSHPDDIITTVVTILIETEFNGRIKDGLDILLFIVIIEAVAVN